MNMIKCKLLQKGHGSKSAPLSKYIIRILLHKTASMLIGPFHSLVSSTT